MRKGSIQRELFSHSYVPTLTNIILPAVGKLAVRSIPVQSPSVDLRGRTVSESNKRPETREELHVTGRPVNIAQNRGLVIVLPRPHIDNADLVCIIRRNAIQAFDSSFNDLTMETREQFF